MKNQRILFYVFKWIALAFLAVLIARENPSKILMFILLAAVALILIWEGIRDFRKQQ